MSLGRITQVILASAPKLARSSEDDIEQRAMLYQVVETLPADQQPVDDHS